MAAAYNYDHALREALKLSEASFKKEQKLREEAKKLQLQMLQKQQQQWNGAKSYETMLQLMKWQPMCINRGVGAGLQNLGNSCFMNANLQCLAYTAPFAQLLCQSNHSSQCKSKKFCALCELESVIPSMLMSRKIVTPKTMFRNLPNINDLLTPGCQEDAHEFIQSLLDKVEMAYDDQQKPHKRRDPQNPIRKLFTGATKTSIECAKCRNKTVTKEPFCCISLEVDDNVGLDEALEIFTQDELLRGDDKYSCNTCKRKCIAHKKLTLSEIPPILILHLKRFAVQFQASHHKQGTMQKLSCHVEFPPVLDFKKLQHLIYEEDRQTALIDSQYELYAVLVHSGPQLGYGHYYALIKSPDGYWYRMNDMDVIPVSLKHVLKEQGYIVFYKRTTDNLMKCELQRIKAQSMSEFNDQGNNNNNNNNNNRNNMQQDEEKHVEPPQIPAMSQNNHNVDNNMKVNTDLLTHDYFANNCNQPQDMVVVDGVNGNNAMAQNANGSADRTQYVHVPPMALRQQLMNDNKLFDMDDDNDLTEVFWPCNQNLDQ